MTRLARPPRVYTPIIGLVSVGVSVGDHCIGMIREALLRIRASQRTETGVKSDIAKVQHQFPTEDGTTRI